MALRLSWLGHPQVEQDGQAVRIEMRKALALLVYLSLEPREHAREALATLFWTDYDQAHALGNLRRTLSSLNKSLGPDWCESTRDTVRLNPAWNLQLDVADFRQRLADARAHCHGPEDNCPVCSRKLAEAAVLYRGDFLEGFTLPDCLEFDDWQLFHRESVRRELGWALEWLAERLAAAEAWREAIDAARRWVGLDPLHEPAHRLLMLLYSRAGERSAAVRQYESCRQIVAAELGQEPEAATRELYEHIVKAELELPVVAPSPHASPSIASPLLQTKVMRPRPRSELVSRPRLLALLDEGKSRPLTLISAPAGFGKTTLLAQWSATQDTGLAWLCLDQGDNHLPRFLAYVAAALNRATGDVGRTTLADLQKLPPVPALSVQASLLNDLARVCQPIALVLDDYHTIDNPLVHECLGHLLANLPPCARIIVAARADPPLALARMRVRGELLEIRAEHLLFSEAEGASLLGRALRQGLTAEETAILVARTEGWAAGLQIAALALRECKDRTAFFDDFGGSHRYLFDYLGQEVLQCQPEAVQRFLLQTSILERLCAPLCDAVVEPAIWQTESGGALDEAVSPASPAQQMLDYLDVNNLFVVALDDERRWYRYHHLFADLLRVQLEAVQPEQLPLLHRRAALWYQGEKLLVQAVKHALAAEDISLAARMIEMRAQRLTFSHEWRALASMLERLPVSVRENSPWLHVYEAWARVLQGLPAETEALLKSAETAARNLPPEEAALLAGSAATIRAYGYELQGDYPRAIAEAPRARTLLPANHRLQRRVALILGDLSFLNCDLARAWEVWQETVSMARAAGDLQALGSVLSILGRLHFERGQPGRALAIYGEVLRLSEGQGQQASREAALARAGMGNVWREQMALAEADAFLSLAVQHLAEHDHPVGHTYGLVLLGRLRQALGSLGEAGVILDEARALANRYAVYPDIRAELEAAELQQLLARKALAEGEWLLQEHAHQISLAPRYLESWRQLLWARLRQAQGRNEEALSLLRPLAQQAEVDGHVIRLIEIRAIQALALEAGGARFEALQALSSSLGLAAPARYASSLISLGREMVDLLQAGQAGECWPESITHFATELLQRLVPGSPPATAFVNPTFVNDTPLTPRELEVLALVARGASNAEIAATLFISLGTVKSHLNHILTKLDARNRTEAVMLASEARLLSGLRPEI